MVHIERSDADRRPCVRANVRSKFPGLHEGNRHGGWRVLRLQLHIAGSVRGIGIGPLSPMPRQPIFRDSWYATFRSGSTTAASLLDSSPRLRFSRGALMAIQDESRQIRSMSAPSGCEHTCGSARQGHAEAHVRLIEQRQKPGRCRSECYLRNGRGQQWEAPRR